MVSNVLPIESDASDSPESVELHYLDSLNSLLLDFCGEEGEGGFNKGGFNIYSLSGIIEFCNFSLRSSSSYIGFVSREFTESSGVDFDFLKQFARSGKNQKYDAFVGSTAVRSEALLPNPWKKISLLFPEREGLFDVISNSFGVDSASSKGLMPTRFESNGHFVLARKAFWAELAEQVQLLLAFIQEQFNEEDRDFLLGAQSQDSKKHFSHLFHPVFSSFLTAMDDKFMVLRVRSNYSDNLSGEALVNLRYLKDLAISTNDQELVRCWAGYRDLYTEI